jgi:hypothetical protein
LRRRAAPGRRQPDDVDVNNWAPTWFAPAPAPVAGAERLARAFALGDYPAA